MRIIGHSEEDYPEKLRQYLGSGAPHIIWARGNLNLVSDKAVRPDKKLWALFCSKKCPSVVILQMYDFVAKLQTEQTPTIGGYHSPLEKECLRILLRGTQPIIICLARGIERMRLRSEWRKPLDQGRLLILSPFGQRNRRPTSQLAMRRNEFVAALADAILIAHASANSKMEKFCHEVLKLGKPLYTFENEANKSLINIGAKPLSPNDLDILT